MIARQQKLETAASLSSTALAAVFSRSATSLPNSVRKVSTSCSPSRNCAALALPLVGDFVGDRVAAGVVGDATLRLHAPLAECEPFRLAGADAGLVALSVEFPTLVAVQACQE